MNDSDEWEFFLSASVFTFFLSLSILQKHNTAVLVSMDDD